jgi:glycosyltransferase involved in cell wall biosynthesis
MKRRRIFYLNANVLAVLFQRSWNIIGGGLTIFFIPLWLTGIEQGYYYAFYGILAFQVFFDLGINFVIVQLVAHEAAWLEISTDGLVTGDIQRLGKLASLMKLLQRWYLKASILFCSLLMVGGYLFFSRKTEISIGHWLPIWALLVVFTSINLYHSPAIAMLEGVGRITFVARLRFVQSIIGYLATWLALAFGAGLHSVYMLPAVSAGLAIWWVQKNRLKLPEGADSVSLNNSIKWRVDILPLQWRIALSWLSGYLIFNAFTPFIFSNQGAVEAGRIGIALSIFTSLSNLVMSWSNAATPEMITLIARGDRQSLIQLFFRVIRSSAAFSIISASAVVVAVALLPWFGLGSVASRIAPISTLVCLATANIANSVVFAAAIFMRAHKKEPMLGVSVVLGILNIIALYFASQVNSFLPVAIFTALTVGIGLPWTLLLLRPYLDTAYACSAHSSARDTAAAAALQAGQAIGTVSSSDGISEAAPKLTVCVACYNRPDYARAAIQSILSQSNQKFSILISDNSTTSEVFEMVKRNFPDVPYFRRSPSLKACEHFNEIILGCRSEYVMVMHDDDMLDPRYAENMLRFIDNFPGRVCYACNASVIDAQGDQRRSRFYLSMSRHLLSHDPHWLTRRWFAYATLSVAPFPSYIYERRTVAKIRFDTVKYGQFTDYAFIHQCLLNGGAMAWLNEPLYRYRTHGLQDSAGITFASYTKIKNYIRQFEPEHYRSRAFSLTRATMLTGLEKLKTYSERRRRIQMIKVSYFAASPSAAFRKVVLLITGQRN